MKKICLLSVLFALTASASAPLSPEEWKVQYAHHLKTVQTNPKKSYRWCAAENTVDALEFVIGHWGDPGHDKELERLVELALPRLEKGGIFTRASRFAATILYENPGTALPLRTKAARHLAYEIIESQRDYAAADGLFLPLQRAAETNLNVKGGVLALVNVVTERANLKVLQDDREGAIALLEGIRPKSGGESLQKEFARWLDPRIADVHIKFRDYRAAVDFYLKRGKRNSAFDILRSDKIDDPALAEKLARAIVTEEAEILTPWLWMWGRDEAFARSYMSKALGNNDGTTNRVIRAFTQMVDASPYRLPAPICAHDWEKALRFWEVLKEMLVTSGRLPTARTAQYVAVAAASLGERAKATEAIDLALANTAIKPEERYELELMKTVLALGGDEAAAEAALAAADREFAKTCPAKERTKRFERAASLAIMLKNDPVARGVAHYYKTHYNALPEKRVYTVRFTEKPLGGLSGFDAIPSDRFLGLFGFSVPESDFTRAYGGSTEFFETDVTTGSRGGADGEGGSAVSVRAVADEWGIHLLYTLRTPDARKFESGEANGGSYECYIGTPGEPHRIFLCYPRSVKSVTVCDLNYDKPGFRRTEGKDASRFRSDVRFSDDRVENYVAFSWDSFADVLPEDGTIWDFESLYWGKPSLAWNGTESIHGRSTFGLLKFELDEAGRTRILRQRLYTAARNYAAEKSGADADTSRRRGGLFDTWADPVIGDPAFYAKCLKPIREELDPVAAKIKAGMSDEEVKEIAADYLSRFHNLRFEIAALREKYLTDEILDEEPGRLRTL